MIRSLGGALVFTLGLLLAAGAHGDSQESAAVEAAQEWLALVDAGDYQASWGSSAKLFREAVSASQWKASAEAARRPFGKLVSREVSSAQLARSLPGAPDGTYVVIQYRSVFEHKQGAVETVTPMLDGGAWKVSGYYIR